MKFLLSILVSPLLCGLTTGFTVVHHSQVTKTHPNTQLFAADEFAFKTVPAAEKYSGGPVEVDMNTYNLSLDEAIEEWTASKVSNSGTANGVFLEPKSNRLIFYDKITCKIKRKPGEGLGIELFEVAGGRQDGVGITVVSGLVEGSVSENCGLQPGDSMVDIAVVSGSMELEQATAEMECYDWDETVSRIGGLPAATDDPTESLLVTVKRLRRKPMVEVTVKSPSSSDGRKTIEVFAGENLRRAMMTRGVKLEDSYAKAFTAGSSTEGIPDCTSEKCFGHCEMTIEEGADLLNPITPEEIEKFGEESNKRLACRSIVGHGMKQGKLVVQLAEY